MESIPKCGFGTYPLKGQEAINCALIALREGYDHVDTATLYRNEFEIGKAIKLSGISRDKLWVTTKIQPRDIGKGKRSIWKSILNSLKQLDTDYIDLVLLHAPVNDKLIESWSVLEEIIMGNVVELKNKVRFIGISNYDICHMDVILKNCRIKPYCNQFEITPFYNRPDLLDYCKEMGIIVVAHTSLVKGEKFHDVRLEALSTETGISKSLLLLGWAIAKGMVVLPRSGNEEHIRENIKCLSVKLSEEIIKKLDTFDDGYCLYAKFKKL